MKGSIYYHLSRSDMFRVSFTIISQGQICPGFNLLSFLKVRYAQGPIYYHLSRSDLSMFNLLSFLEVRYVQGSIYYHFSRSDQGSIYYHFSKSDVFRV